jgi:methionine-rich copper-binding protein CopC
MHLARRIAVVIAALALVTLLPGAALGHSELEQADPAPDSTIPEAPTLIVANFTEAIDPTRSTMELRGADGTVLAKGGVAPDDPERVQMTITPPPLDPGTYEVRWTTVTPDDNGILRGTYTFTIAAAASPGPAASTSTAPSAEPSASPSVAPSASPSAASPPAASATPAPSGGESGSSGGPGVVVIVALVVVVAAVLVAVTVYAVRGRRS